MMANTDSAYIGGQTPMTEEFLSNRQRESSGLSPAGAVDVTAQFNGEDVPVPVSVARNALYKHMDVLKGKLAAEIPDPFRFAGNGPYLDEMRRQHRLMAEMAIAEKEQAKAELERLGRLNDAEIVHWAVSNGHVGRTNNGHWVVK